MNTVSNFEMPRAIMLIMQERNFLQNILYSGLQIKEGSLVDFLSRFWGFLGSDPYHTFITVNMWSNINVFHIYHFL